MNSVISAIRAFLDRGRHADQLSDEDFAQMRVTGSVEYLAGALTLTMIALLPNSEGGIGAGDSQPLLMLAGVGLLLAALRFLVPREVRYVRASIMIGFIFVATIIFVARPVGPTPFFFIWPVLTTAYFLGRRDLAWAIPSFSTFLLAALLLNPGAGGDLRMFLPTQAVIVVVSLLVLVLRERVDRLVGDLEYTASTDMLTNLPNRRTFTAAFDRELERSRRSETPLALAVFDLDHFKQINDKLGHAEGDRALQRFSDVLRNECRVVDVPARVGGEEFALLLSNADAEGARVFAQRLIDRLKEVTANDPAPLSVSVGVTEVSSAADTQDVLLLAADRALYEAKNTGRGRVVVARVATPSRAEHTGERLEISTQPTAISLDPAGDDEAPSAA